MIFPATRIHWGRHTSRNSHHHKRRHANGSTLSSASVPLSVLLLDPPTISFPAFAAWLVGLSVPAAADQLFCIALQRGIGKDAASSSAAEGCFRDEVTGLSQAPLTWLSDDLSTPYPEHNLVPPHLQTSLSTLEKLNLQHIEQQFLLFELLADEDAFVVHPVQPSACLPLAASVALSAHTVFAGLFQREEGRWHDRQQDRWTLGRTCCYCPAPAPLCWTCSENLFYELQSPSRGHLSDTSSVAVPPCFPSTLEYDSSLAIPSLHSADWKALRRGFFALDGSLLLSLLLLSRQQQQRLLLVDPGGYTGRRHAAGTSRSSAGKRQPLRLLMSIFWRRRDREAEKALCAALAGSSGCAPNAVYRQIENLRRIFNHIALAVLHQQRLLAEQRSCKRSRRAKHSPTAGLESKEAASLAGSSPAGPIHCDTGKWRDEGRAGDRACTPEDHLRSGLCTAESCSVCRGGFLCVSTGEPLAATGAGAHISTSRVQPCVVGFTCCPKCSELLPPLAVVVAVRLLLPSFLGPALGFLYWRICFILHFHVQLPPFLGAHSSKSGVVSALSAPGHGLWSSGVPHSKSLRLDAGTSAHLSRTGAAVLGKKAKKSKPLKSSSSAFHESALRTPPGPCCCFSCVDQVIQKFLFFVFGQYKDSSRTTTSVSGSEWPSATSQEQLDAGEDNGLSFWTEDTSAAQAAATLQLPLWCITGSAIVARRFNLTSANGKNGSGTTPLRNFEALRRRVLFYASRIKQCLQKAGASESEGPAVGRPYAVISGDPHHFSRVLLSCLPSVERAPRSAEGPAAGGACLLVGTREQSSGAAENLPARGRIVKELDAAGLPDDAFMSESPTPLLTGREVVGGLLALLAFLSCFASQKRFQFCLTHLWQLVDILGCHDFQTSDRGDSFTCGEPCGRSGYVPVQARPDPWQTLPEKTCAARYGVSPECEEPRENPHNNVAPGVGRASECLCSSIDQEEREPWATRPGNGGLPQGGLPGTDEHPGGRRQGSSLGEQVKLGQRSLPTGNEQASKAHSNGNSTRHVPERQTSCSASSTPESQRQQGRRRAAVRLFFAACRLAFFDLLAEGSGASTAKAKGSICEQVGGRADPVSDPSQAHSDCSAGRHQGGESAESGADRGNHRRRFNMAWRQTKQKRAAAEDEAENTRKICAVEAELAVAGVFIERCCGFVAALCDRPLQVCGQREIDKRSAGRSV